MSFLLAAVAALPWIVLPLLIARRMGQGTSLDSESAEAPEHPPMVSVIVPARNEARNIAECVRSILGNAYPSFEVIVVNDQSTDDTGEIAGRIARDDPRLRVLQNDAPPPGWLGKPWACATGARHAIGELLCFADADTIHRPDALVRSVNMILRRKADLFSVFCRQRLETHWERIVMPQIFALLAVRFGGTEIITRSSRAQDKIANGQFLFVTRKAYDELGGHAPVRGYPTEDIALAQRFFSNGKHVVLTNGTQVSTRMYTSLKEIISGWGRTLYAAHRLSVPLEKRGGILYPVLFVLPPLFQLAPSIGLASVFLIPDSAPLLVWSVMSLCGMLAWWFQVYRHWANSFLYALIHPVGALIVLYICVGALFRGRRISWKGRAYVIE